MPPVHTLCRTPEVEVCQPAYSHPQCPELSRAPTYSAYPYPSSGEMWKQRPREGKQLNLVLELLLFLDLGNSWEHQKM